MNTLKDRIENYQLISDYKLLNRVPIIICINGKGFAKLTQLLHKPYCSQFAECILSTSLRLCSEIEGAVFCYQHNDEMVIISCNDQNNETTPWFNNKIQKICSIASSIATLHFNACVNAIDLNLTGDPIFTAQVFAVPNITEAINTLIFKQQQNFHTSIQSASLYNLLNKYDRSTIKEMLTGLSIDEKIDLLSQECGVDFNDNYSAAFRRGVGCYKVPKIIDGVMKNKWMLNDELPIFSKDQALLANIIKNGADIFRAD